MGSSKFTHAALPIIEYSQPSSKIIQQARSTTYLCFKHIIPSLFLWGCLCESYYFRVTLILSPLMSYGMHVGYASIVLTYITIQNRGKLSLVLNFRYFCLCEELGAHAHLKK